MALSSPSYFPRSCWSFGPSRSLLVPSQLLLPPWSLDHMVVVQLLLLWIVGCVSAVGCNLCFEVPFSSVSSAAKRGGGSAGAVKRNVMEAAMAECGSMVQQMQSNARPGAHAEVR